MKKIAAIECSLRCFTCGLLGLVPIVGAGFGVAALMNFVRASDLDWNPARRYGFLGLFFAIFGLLINLASWWLLFLYLKNEFGN